MLRALDLEGTADDFPRPLGVKRWRVKRAVVTALGQIGDLRAVAPIEEALRHGTDYFAVTSQMAVALGRLGSQGSLDILEPLRDTPSSTPASMHDWRAILRG